jgi:putrescine transport system ATP-binding protein
VTSADSSTPSLASETSAVSAGVLLEVRKVVKRFGTREVLRQLSLQIARGEFLTLLGESGSGKTTLLRLVAGFEPPTSGEIWMNGERMDALPPYRRRVNTVFQHYALFPHLSVQENVAYGLQVTGVAAAEISLRVADALRMVKMHEYAATRPAKLSGGQQQRVALARALVNRPQLLLLDEPLSALDANLRKQMQGELKSLQRELGITFLFVTHDQDEAMALSTRIAVMNRGQVVQVGTPSEIYEFPQNRFVADFIGTTNLFEGTVSGTEPGHLIVRSAEAGCDLIVDEVGRFGSGQRVWVALRPEKIRLSKEPIAGSRFNQIKGMVWELGYLGNRSTYRIKTDTGKLVTVFAQNDRRTSEWSIDWSDEVYLSWTANCAVVLQQ